MREVSGVVVDVVERGVAQFAGNLAKKVLRAGRRGILECVTRPFRVHRVWGDEPEGPNWKRLRNHTGPPELPRDAASGGQGWTQQAAFGPCPQATPRGKRP